MEKSTKWIGWALWIIAMAWGVFGVSQRFLHGELQVNYGSYIPWGLWVAGKVYLVGLGVGTSLFAWIVYAFDLKRYFLLARQALLASAIALLMGMLVIAFDLGHIWRSFEPLYRPQFHSLLAWATLLTVIELLYVIFVICLGIASKGEPGSRRLFRMQRCGVCRTHRPSLLELHTRADPFHCGGPAFRIRPVAFLGRMVPKRPVGKRCYIAFSAQ
jgi:Ni/Fe-hydrogenase subunit HybB-like protein